MAVLLSIAGTLITDLYLLLPRHKYPFLPSQTQTQLLKPCAEKCWKDHNLLCGIYVIECYTHDQEPVHVTKLVLNPF